MESPNDDTTAHAISQVEWTGREVSDGNEDNAAGSPFFEEDGGASLWSERAERGLRALVTPFVVALFFLLDISMDFQLAASRWSEGNPTWAGLTLGVVLFSLVFVDIISVSFYFSDQEDPDKTWWLKQDKLHVRPWFYFFHFPLCCGRLLRCFQAFKTVLIIRKVEEKDRKELQNIQRYRLYISQLYEMSILGVVEAFTEEAPQVTLQFYIMLQKGIFDWTSSADIFAAVNIFKSVILFSCSLVNFAVRIRRSKDDTGSLKWISWASFLYFFWRLFMIISRLQAFALFANVFKGFVFLMVAVHLMVSCILICLQKDTFFEPGSARARDILFRSAFCCINIFCFFPLEGTRTRRWAIPYYIFIFVETSVVTLTWYFCSKFSKAFKITMLVVSWATFFLGIACVLLYHGFFHPSITGNPRGNSENCPTTEEEVKVDSGNGYMVFESSV